jgi:hypothetical protein
MLFSPKARSISSRYVSLYALILYDVGEARGGGQPAGGGKGGRKGEGGRRTTKGGGGEGPFIDETDRYMNSWGKWRGLVIK